MKALAAIAARLVRLSHIVDRGYQRFDRVRSRAVMAAGSRTFHQAYTRLAYGATSAYRAGAEDFREGLFPWEEKAIAAHFPLPPARILIGGAGGGREAFALVARGYEIVAFDPANPLVESMRRKAASAGETRLTAYCAEYGDLPWMPESGSGRVDLRRQPPFDAAILGWTSLSHLVSDSERVRALSRMARLTAGPLLASYFGRKHASSQGRTHRGGIDGDTFTIATGYTRLLTEEEFTDLAIEAGLRVVSFDRDNTWPNAVLRSGVRGAEAESV